MSLSLRARANSRCLILLSLKSRSPVHSDRELARTANPVQIVLVGSDAGASATSQPTYVSVREKSLDRPSDGRHVIGIVANDEASAALNRPAARRKLEHLSIWSRRSRGQRRGKDGRLGRTAAGPFPPSVQTSRQIGDGATIRGHDRFAALRLLQRELFALRRVLCSLQNNDKASVRRRSHQDRL